MSKYEYWEVVTETDEEESKRLFVRSDHNGDRLRAKLPEDAQILWECEAETFYHAMCKYWEFLGLGEYISIRDHIFPGDEL